MEWSSETLRRQLEILSVTLFFLGAQQATAWLLDEVLKLRQFNIPSGYVNSLLLKMTIEIVNFPIKNGDFPRLC